MSRDTILGNVPDGTPPVPAGVGPHDGGTDQATTATSRPADADPLDRDLPGDAQSAYHRSRLFSLLALGFERPGEALGDAIEADAFSTDLVESAHALDEEDLTAPARAVAAAIEDPATLRPVWVSLYGVEDDISVSPYELTYLPGPLMTNVRNLADLSGFYEAFDLEIVPEHNDRQDHISFLLEFLGHLSLREAVLRTQNNDRGVAVVVDARRQFVEDHIGRWYWRFTDDVSQHADGFYASLAELLAAVLADEIDRLDVDPDWVPDVPEVTDWSEDVFGDSGRTCGGCGVSPDDLAGSASTPTGPDGPDRPREG